MGKPRILVIDDEEIIRMSCKRILEPEGYEVKLAQSGSEGLKAIEKESFDLALIDIKMRDMDGIEVLRRVKEGWPDIEVAIITGYGTVRSAVQAMKFGAFDYIEKPFTPENLLLTISDAIEKKRLSLKDLRPRQNIEELYRIRNVVGVSKGMQKVFQLIKRVAPTAANVLLTGESGTGKELVARAIHYNSVRKEQPFIVADSGKIPDSQMESELFGYMEGAFAGATASKKGLFELANGGTIFFNEIGNLGLSNQTKFLRAIDKGEIRPIGGSNSMEIDVRVITATEKDLEAMTREGSFSGDLFYRLNIFPIILPPLRERKEDIPLLSEYFLQKHSKYLGKEVIHISAEAMKILISHEWPGNVRQLDYAIYRAILLCNGKTIRHYHLNFLETKSIENMPKNMIS